MTKIKLENMGFATNANQVPLRHQRNVDPNAARAQHKSLHRLVFDTFRKLLPDSGCAKKYSQHKPKLHNRSVTPHDIHKAWHEWKSRRGDFHQLDGAHHEVTEFFTSPNSTSPSVNQLPDLPPRYEDSGSTATAQRPSVYGGRKYRVSPTTDERQPAAWILRPRQKPAKTFKVKQRRSVLQESTAPNSSYDETDQSYDDKRGRPPSNVRRGKELAAVEEGRGEEDEDEEVEVHHDNGLANFIQGIWDNSDRASFGMKLTREFFGFADDSSNTQQRSRPFFTVWVTIVQIIIFIVIISVYGVAPIGIGQDQQTAQVLMTDLSVRTQSNPVQRNLWIGPRQDDLIHLGAKYSPCMRQDISMNAVLLIDKQVENQTGCCVNNDGSGCVQTSDLACSPTISTWMKWTAVSPGPGGRLSGSVCGQDPRYCLSPASDGAHVWPDDITAWPVCTATSNVSLTSPDYNMVCQIVGRPCCIGIQAVCIMATREYCSFMRGYFHENATLCAQVSCIGQICGMLPFSDPSKPDQFYRFFISLFVHPGLLALVITIIFQFLLQYDLERRIGSFAMIFIYLACGLGGNVTSCIFIPYYVSAGPDGSQFGVLAALTMEIIRWNVEKPHRQIIWLFVCMIVLFFIGAIVPQIDNWAHLTGYVLGLVLAYGFNPIELSSHVERLQQSARKCIVYAFQIFCFAFVIITIIILLVIFYDANYVVTCQSCMYFNCIPFTSDYCDGMSVNITRS